MRQVLNWGANQEQVTQQTVQLEALKYQLNRAQREKSQVSERYNQARQSNQSLVSANQKLRMEFQTMQEQLRVNNHDIGTFRSSTVAKLSEHSSLLQQMEQQMKQECKQIPVVDQKCSAISTRLAQVELQVSDMALQVQNLVLNLGQFSYFLQQTQNKDPQSSSPGGDTAYRLSTPSANISNQCSRQGGAGTQTKRKRIRLVYSTGAEVLREHTSEPTIQQSPNYENLEDMDVQDAPHACQQTNISDTQYDTNIQNNNQLQTNLTTINTQLSLPDNNIDRPAANNIYSTCNKDQNQQSITLCEYRRIGDNIIQQIHALEAPEQPQTLISNQQIAEIQQDIVQSENVNRDNVLKRSSSCLQRSPKESTKEPKLMPQKNNACDAFLRNSIQSEQQQQQLLQVQNCRNSSNSTDFQLLGQNQLQQQLSCNIGDINNNINEQNTQNPEMCQLQQLQNESCVSKIGQQQSIQANPKQCQNLQQQQQQQNLQQSSTQQVQQPLQHQQQQQIFSNVQNSESQLQNCVQQQHQQKQLLEKKRVDNGDTQQQLIQIQQLQQQQKSICLDGKKNAQSPPTQNDHQQQQQVFQQQLHLPNFATINTQQKYCQRRQQLLLPQQEQQQQHVCEDIGNNQQQQSCGNIVGKQQKSGLHQKVQNSECQRKKIQVRNKQSSSNQTQVQNEENSDNEGSTDDCARDVLRGSCIDEEGDLTDVSRRLSFASGGGEEEEDDILNLEKNQNIEVTRAIVQCDQEAPQIRINPPDININNMGAHENLNEEINKKSDKQRKKVSFASEGKNNLRKQPKKTKSKNGGSFNLNRQSDGGRQSCASVDSDMLGSNTTTKRSNRRGKVVVSYAEPKLNAKLSKSDKFIFQGVPDSYKGSSVEEQNYYSKKKTSNTNSKKS